MDSNFWLGISAGILLGGIVFGLSFIGIFDNKIILSGNKWNCTQSRIIDPKNVNKVECIVYVRSDAK